MLNLYLKELWVSTKIPKIDTHIPPINGDRFYLIYQHKEKEKKRGRGRIEYVKREEK